MLDKLLPKFKVVEINNMAALRMGHVIAQTPAYIEGNAESKTAIVAHVPHGEYKFVENGLIVGFDKDNCLANYTTDHKQPMLVYTEELETSGLVRGLDRFANVVDNKGKVYVRALPLYVGDTFTTNNIDSTDKDGYAKVVNGKLTYTAAPEEGMFIVKKSTLPNGEKAVEVTYVG